MVVADPPGFDAMVYVNVVAPVTVMVYVPL
jgi:hypothetical protein